MRALPSSNATSMRTSHKTFSNPSQSKSGRGCNRRTSFFVLLSFEAFTALHRYSTPTNKDHYQAFTRLRPASLQTRNQGLPTASQQRFYTSLPWWGTDVDRMFPILTGFTSDSLWAALISAEPFGAFLARFPVIPTHEARNETKYLRLTPL